MLLDLTYLEDLCVGVAMDNLLHHVSQKLICDLRTQTLLVMLFEHVVFDHVLQDRRLASHRGG